MNEITFEKKNLPFNMAEEVINLRTGITFSGEDIKTVMFTSCMMNEGKSTITVELTRSFAELGKKTVLIDVDLRKSIIGNKVTEGKMKKGLTHYLTGQCELDEIIYMNNSRDDEEFYIIPAGPATNSPTELLASNKFQHMMEKLRNQFDMIIVDTPPLGTVIDAAVIAPTVDGAVIVIESGKIDYKLAQKIRDKLISSNCKILGTVLNKVDKNVGSYGYYKYGKEYGYGYGYSSNEQ